MFVTAAKTLVAALALMLLLAACDQELGAGAGDDWAAMVNGEEIPAEDVESQLDAVTDDPEFEQQAEMMGGEDALRGQLGAQILNQRINGVLIRQGAEERGVEVTDEDLDAQREEIAADIEEQTGMGLEEFAESQGLTEEDIDLDLELLAYQEGLLEQLAEDGEIEDEEIAEARHILTEDEDAADEARERIEDGEDFADVAEDASEDPGSAEEGGDLGEFTRGQMDEAFDDAVFEAEAGDLLGPVETQFGFHIIEVLALETQAYEDLDDEGQLQRQQTVINEELLPEMIEDAEIEVDEEYGSWDAELGQVVPPEDAEMPEPDGMPAPEGEDMEDMEELDEEELEEELEELEDLED